MENEIIYIDGKPHKWVKVFEAKAELTKETPVFIVEMKTKVEPPQIKSYYERSIWSRIKSKFRRK